jgi:hypothetical protein
MGRILYFSDGLHDRITYKNADIGTRVAKEGQ